MARIRIFWDGMGIDGSFKYSFVLFNISVLCLLSDTHFKSKHWVSQETEASNSAASSHDVLSFSDIEDRNFFQSVHNVVYFAVGVLEKQAE